MLGMRSVVATMFGIITIAALGSAPAHGQAWVGPKGSGSVGMDFTFTESSGLLVNSARFHPLDGVGNKGFTATLTSEWVPIDKWGVTMQIPFTVNKLFAPPGFDTSVVGSAVFLGRHVNDEVSTFQDFSLEARRAYKWGDWAFAPSIGFSTPMENYEIQTFRLAGRGLSEFRLGAAVGTRFSKDKAYFHVREVLSLYNTLGSRVNNILDDVRLKQFNTTVDLGFQVSDKLTLSTNASFRQTSGGIECAEAIQLLGQLLGGVPLSVRDTDRLLFHFPLRNESFFLLGGEAEYQISKHWSAFAGYKDMVHGNNTQPAHLFTTGATWSFE